MKTLRLILGDQLNVRHSWFKTIDPSHHYFLFELTQELTYVHHHAQKIVCFFTAMRAFAAGLSENGHSVTYLSLDNPDAFDTLDGSLNHHLKAGKFDRFEYLLPDEYRLDVQLRNFCTSLTISTESFDTEHFLFTREEFRDWASGKRQLVMENFYRLARSKFSILTDAAGQPEGGRWNFDKENQKRFDHKETVPLPLTFSHDNKAIIDLLKSCNVLFFGEIKEDVLDWPTNRTEATAILKDFCENKLYRFGTYEDAMDSNLPSLFHARISFALNSKLLSPLEVVEAAVTAYKEHTDIALNQVEGFIRQILGWREYMRGIYWLKMPEYASLNFFDHRTDVPSFYWNAGTKMNCMSRVIRQSLDQAWAHHIQRLMVVGNFSMLAGLNPDQVDDWYLGIYIDAIEWVEITNTRGMSQYADGGICGTKPYAASANYINKMSDYCKSCYYLAPKRHGDRACPFNSLYWRFFKINASLLAQNPRLFTVYNLLARMPADELDLTLNQANLYLTQLESL